MIKSKRNIMVIGIIILALLTALSVFLFIRYNQTVHTVPFSYTDGFKAKVPIPKGSIFVRDYGLALSEFRTSKSETEVKQFYDNYFSGLKKVHAKSNGQIAEMAAYYDEMQRLVILSVETQKINGKTRFDISYESYKEQNWSID